MKTLVVTSMVTFVPQNYDDLVCALADCPQVGGLLVLDNRDWHNTVKALGLFLLGARRFGTTLLKNTFGGSSARRFAAFRAAGKNVWVLPTINAPEAVDLVKREGFDLVLNARTRFIYRDAILSAPRLGCINVHHGLLPDERGTMCDLWALHEGKPAGFSVHQMTAKVDAGAILRRVVVTEKRGETGYMAHLQRSSQRELETVCDVLAQIERESAIRGEPNVPSRKVYRKNPKGAEIRAMIQAGLL